MGEFFIVRFPLKDVEHSWALPANCQETPSHCDNRKLRHQCPKCPSKDLAPDSSKNYPVDEGRLSESCVPGPRGFLLPVQLLSLNGTWHYSVCHVRGLDVKWLCEAAHQNLPRDAFASTSPQSSLSKETWGKCLSCINPRTHFVSSAIVLQTQWGSHVALLSGLYWMLHHHQTNLSSTASSRTMFCGLHFTNGLHPWIDLNSLSS